MESYNNKKFCFICQQKFYDVDDRNNSNDSNIDSSDKVFDLKKSHKLVDKINDIGNDSNDK